MAQYYTSETKQNIFLTKETKEALQHFPYKASELTPGELFPLLELYINNFSTHSQGFILSLCNFFNQKGHVSEKQLYWARKYLTELLEEVKKPEEIQEDPIKNVRITRLVSMFNTALNKGINRPKITINDTENTGGDIYTIFYHPHYKELTVSCNDQYIFGIKQDGSIKRILNKNFTYDQVTEKIKFIKLFDSDPAKLAKLHGHRTGNCCFCRKQLTTPESVSVGYGPICANNYGLPWGEVSLSTLVDEEIG